ncbi:MAG TPA: PfkB family carbohydrate kinase, partial [Prolixibacteraceae bacterium]|nr:PfkB family carbohydrate kinase [Prolixibacteraceae bacterium]
MNKKIVAFGELIWDVFQDGKKLGGAPVNLAYRANTLGDSGCLLSRIGEDDLGREALEMLKKLAVTDKYVQMDPVFPTGYASVRIGSEGRPDYLIAPDLAFDHIEITPEILDLAGSADCICFGTLVQRSGISKNTLRELIAAAPQALKFLDLRLRKNCYSAKNIEDSLKAANMLRVKESELYLIKNELGLFEYDSRGLAQELISEYDLDIVLVTR